MRWPRSSNTERMPLLLWKWWCVTCMLPAECGRGAVYGTLYAGIGGGGAMTVAIRRIGTGIGTGDIIIGIDAHGWAIIGCCTP